MTEICQCYLKLTLVVKKQQINGEKNKGSKVINEMKKGRKR